MRTTVLLAFLVCLTGLAHADNIVNNGDFARSKPGDNVQPGTDIGGWITIKGIVQVLYGNGHTYVFFKSGGIQQMLSTVPGRTYTVTANIYGIHHSYFVVRAGDDITQLQPSNDGSDVVRTWSFRATSSKTPLEISVPSDTEISLNSIRVESLTAADLARGALDSIYGTLDQALNYQRFTVWQSQTAPDFAWTSPDGTVLHRATLEADLTKMAAGTSGHRTHVVTVTAVSDTDYTAQVEESAMVDVTRADGSKTRQQRKTQYDDTWRHDSQGWWLVKRVEHAATTTPSSTEYTPLP